MNGGALVPVDVEIAEIETTIRDDGTAYWRDPAMRRRYGELLEMRAGRGATPRPHRPDAVASEIAVIEQRMRDDFAAYRADPEMQARYGALLEAREGGDTRAGAGKAEPSPGRDAGRDAATEALGRAEDARDHLRAAGRHAALEALSEGGTGNFEGNLRAVQMVAVDVARDLNDPDAAEGFVEAFTRLPDRAQANAYATLLRDGSGYPAASDAALDTFRAEDDAAASLLAEWGADAARRLGVAKG